MLGRHWPISFSDLVGASVCRHRFQALRLQKATRILLGLSPDESAAAIIHELESGRDVSTGLEFEVGDEGLQSAPTWRVFLLDLLGTIDPKAAADFCRALLAGRVGCVAAQHPAQLAVALRSRSARGDRAPVAGNAATG